MHLLMGFYLPGTVLASARRQVGRHGYASPAAIGLSLTVHSYASGQKCTAVEKRSRLLGFMKMERPVHNLTAVSSLIRSVLWITKRYDEANRIVSSPSLCYESYDTRMSYYVKDTIL